MSLKEHTMSDSDVYSVAKRIFEQLLEANPDDNHRHNLKVRRSKTGPNIGSNGKIKCENIVTRSNTMPATYMEPTRLELKGNEENLLDKVSQVQGPPNDDLGGEGSTADTEDNLSYEPEKRKKKSFLKRAKERILFTLNRNQHKESDNENNNQDKSKTKGHKSEKKKNKGNEKSKHDRKSQTAEVKSVDYTDQRSNQNKDWSEQIPAPSSKKGNIWTSFRRSKKSSRTTEDPRTSSPRAEEPRTSSPRAEEPRTSSPRAEEPRTSSPRAEEPRTSSPRAEEPCTSSPRAEEPHTQSSFGGGGHYQEIIVVEGSPQGRAPGSDLHGLESNLHRPPQHSNDQTFSEELEPATLTAATNQCAQQSLDDEPPHGTSSTPGVASSSSSAAPGVETIQHADSTGQGSVYDHASGVLSSVLDYPGEDIAFIDAYDSDIGYKHGSVDVNRDKNICLGATVGPFDDSGEPHGMSYPADQSPDSIHRTVAGEIGHVAATQRPDGSGRRTSEGPAGRAVLSRPDGRGQTTSAGPAVRAVLSRPDGSGRRTSEGPAGRAVLSRPDGSGQTTSAGPAGRAVLSRPDGSGRRTSEGPAGRAVLSRPDGRGQTTSAGPAGRAVLSRPDGRGQTTSAGPAGRAVLSMKLNEGDTDEVDGLHQAPINEHQNANADREALYSMIAQKLIDIGDSYSSAATDGEPRPSPPESESQLSPLEKEIIECIRSVNSQESLQTRQDIYQRFCSTVQNSMGSELSWHHVAVLFYTSKEVISIVGKGSRAALDVKDFTLRYVSDTFAAWIMDQGGFSNVMSSEESDFGVD